MHCKAVLASLSLLGYLAGAVGNAAGRRGKSRWQRESSESLLLLGGVR